MPEATTASFVTVVSFVVVNLSGIVVVVAIAVREVLDGTCCFTSRNC